MAEMKRFVDLLQELLSAKKTGALYVSVREKSEDMVRFYFKDGVICRIRYGSALGNDCLDILEYYSLDCASFLEGFGSSDASSGDLPATREVIARFRKSGQIVRTGTEPTDL